MDSQEKNLFRSAMRWQADSFDYRFSRPEEHDGERDIVDILLYPQEGIGVGDPHNNIDELSPLQRQLLQDTDFHVAGTSLLKKVDQEDAAREGDWGNDWTEGDLQDVLKRLADRPDALAWFIQHQAALDDTFYSDPNDALSTAEFGLEAFHDPHDLVEAAEAAGEDGSDPFVRLNSQFCGLGYRPPRDKYRVVHRKKRNFSHEAAERRVTNLKRTLLEIVSLGTSGRIVDVRAKDPVEEWEKFVDRLRDDYAADKALRAEWSEERKRLDRELYLTSLRKQDLDEETIRRRVWAAFDRKQETIPAVYREDGSLEKPSRVMKPSVWDEARSLALQDLVLTSEQWNRVYQSAWVKLGSILRGMATVASTFQQKKRVLSAAYRYRKFLPGLDKELADIVYPKISASEL